MPPAMTAPQPIVDQLRALVEAELKKGTSLREIARRADVAVSVIGNLKAGKTVNIETADAIAKALGKPLRLG